MTEIIRNEITLTTKGKHRGGNCKTIVEPATGKRWSSEADCAKELGVSPLAVSHHMCGRSKSVGKRSTGVAHKLRYANDTGVYVNETLDHVAALQAEVARLREKADAWDAMLAAEEAKRKAENERLAKIAKLEDERDKANEQIAKLMCRVAEINTELAALETE